MAEIMGSGKRQAFICGYHPKGKVKLLPEERKVIHNFSEFLRGKGKRCPQCLHKVKRHELRCGVKGCDCNLDNTSVLVVRKQIGAK